MLLELPAVIKGTPTTGCTYAIIERKSSPQQRGVGVKVGEGPRMVCRLPVLISQGKYTLLPPNMANSKAKSMAQSAEAKELVTPSIPSPLVILSSEIMRVPPAGLSTCPLQVKRCRMQLRQLASLSRSSIVKLLVLLKMTLLTVKAKFGLFLKELYVLSHDGSAACVTPGPQQVQKLF